MRAAAEVVRAPAAATAQEDVAGAGREATKNVATEVGKSVVGR